MECNNIEELIEEYKRLHPNGHYFDEDTLNFFGESVDKMELLGTDKIFDVFGEETEVYVVRRFQKNHPMGPKYANAYFRVDTLDDISAYTKDGEEL